MADVFISYARADRMLAQTIADAIMERGWTVWWDRDLVAGVSFVQAIENQLRSAKCVVVIWTTASAASSWVLNEASEGLHREILIPIVLGDARPPLGFRHVHSIGMATTESQDASMAIAECLSTIATMLGATHSESVHSIDSLSLIHQRVLAAHSRQELERLAAELQIFNATHPPSADAEVLQQRIRRALARETRLELDIGKRRSLPKRYAPAHSFDLLFGFLKFLALAAIAYGAWKLADYFMK